MGHVADVEDVKTAMHDDVKVWMRDREIGNWAVAGTDKKDWACEDRCACPRGW